MILTGVLINAAAVAAGGVLGTLGGRLMPEKMRQTVLGATALVSMGIDPGRIYMEDRSRSTEENLAFSAELIRANGLPADVKAEAARKAEERLKYMTFYSTTQDCLRGFLLHYFGEAAPKKCGNCSCCLAAEQEAQLQVEYSRRRAADNARRLSEKPRRARTTAGELSEFDQKLLNALYAQRKRLAGKQNIPAFMVFSDATLREMVERKPLSTDELLNISGVGEKKAARYGNAFLRIIEDAVGSRE